MTRAHAKARRKRRRVVAAVTSVAGVLLLAGAAALGGGALLYPEQTEAAVGGAKVYIQGAVSEVVNDVPTITLGGLGDRYALDTADFGVFVEMEGYRIDGVPPVFAAHNNRGGDVILSWEMGERVRVVDADGGSKEYVVTEERFTPKWAQVTTLEGMAGAIVVQTCFYGEDRMRFLALDPL